VSAPIRSFLSVIDEWGYNIPLQSQWIVKIYDFPSAIKSQVPNLERISGSDWNIGSAFDKLTSPRVQSNPAMGCFFAQTVGGAPESYGVSVANLGSSGTANGGLIPGLISTGRADFANRPLSISFRDTNLSFVDVVIRPWVILAAHMGRIADGNNIKSHIQVIHFARGSRTSRPIRKITNYYGATPISVEAISHTYEEDSTVKIVATQWVYDNYSIETA
jgi:hypothetical protein